MCDFNLNSRTFAKSVENIKTLIFDFDKLLRCIIMNLMDYLRKIKSGGKWKSI
jgi:hypothetical protein